MRANASPLKREPVLAVAGWWGRVTDPAVDSGRKPTHVPVLYLIQVQSRALINISTF